jgi:hypothetical protein
MSASPPAIRTLPTENPARSRRMIGAGWRNTWGVFRTAPFLLAVLLICAPILGAQGPQDDEPMGRIPLPTKKTLTGAHRAFSGKVETLDLKRKILIVGTVEGSATEIFPIKKGTPVSGAKGKKLKLEELAPGTNIIVYYDYRGDRRSVNEITVLAVNPPQEEKKESPPPS